MATELDKLIVKIEADLSDLKRDMDKVNRLADTSGQKFTKSLRKIGVGFANLGTKVAKFGTLTTAVLSGVAIKGFVDVGIQIENLQIRLEALFGSASEGQKAFDNMVKFAAKVPFTLQEIQQASGNLAVVADDADHLAEILEITGNVAAVTGLDFRQTGEQIQRSFSGGIASADVFRERGVRSLLGFQQGAEVTVEETIKRFKEVFGKGGEFGKMTDELANSLTGTVSMIGDKFFAFQKSVVDGFFNELKKQFGDLNKFLADNEAKIRMFGQELGESLAKLIKLTAENTENIKNFFIALAGVGVLSMLASLTNAINTLTVAMLANPIFAAIAGTVAITGLGIFGGIKLAEFVTNLTRDTVKITDEIKKQNKEFREGQDMLLNYNRTQKKVADAVFKVYKDIDPVRKKQEQADEREAKRIAKKAEDMAKLIELNNQFAESQGRLTVRLNATKDELTDYQKTMEGVINIINQAGQSIAQAFSQAIVHGKDFKDSMVDIFQTIISKVIELIIQIKLIEPFMENLEDVLRGTNTAKDKDSTSAVGGRVLGDIIEKGFDFLGLAGGGTVQPNTPYMVGEQGRELFMSNTGGKMVPNHMLGSNGQPIVIEQNLNFATGVSQTVRAEVMNLLPTIRDNTLSAVRDARLRGGTFAKDFGA